MYKKVVLYYAEQGQYEGYDEAYLKGLDDTIARLKEEKKDLEGELGEVEKEVVRLSEELSDLEIKEKMASVTSLLAKVDKDLEKLSGREPVPEAIIRAAEDILVKLCSEWKKRKTLVFFLFFTQ
eukprot:TRINITY_DN704_c0_g1_i4.p2 TRINITY_DN704_c0_g1~~TRINITY_DN704_c0_g1_i4.p2  ORF type:complete len:124 (-),score=30.74 TRINITY_DN704_c0_g1_i4:237-608(-)